MTNSKRYAHAHVEAKITVHSSEAKPYDQTASPALLEIDISERFSGGINGESTVRALQVQRNDKSAAWLAYNDFREQSMGVGAPSCFKVKRSLRTAISRRNGLSFPVRAQASLPGCAERAASKAGLGKAPKDGWITGSHDMALSSLTSKLGRPPRNQQHH